ncbi:MAG TPA: alpha/beta fold hydrolase [Gemmatimonadales bacterium]|nr:alpha/beta fold hydrolase [Gemmatimonadales bacterium]
MAMTVLFIHGFPFDHTMWRHQLAALSGWSCVAPDLRGFGESPGGEADDPAQYTMSMYADDLIAQLDHMGIRETVVCGLSMGGYIAFELLRSHPARVKAAILCNTKASADTPEGKADRDAMAALARHQGATAIAEKLLPKLLSPVTVKSHPQVVEEVRAMITRTSVNGIVGALHALRERPDSTPSLKRIGVPVLVVAGEDDQITPAPLMREMASAIPGAKFAKIAEAGHVTPLEQPRNVSAGIAAFLRTLG